MAKTINNTDTDLSPMGKTMTINERTTLKEKNLRNEENPMSHPGLSDDTLFELEKLIATGQLTKEGQEWLKLFLEIRTVEQVLEIIDYATGPASLSTADALTFLEQIETGVNRRMADFREGLRTNDGVSLADENTWRRVVK